MILKKKINSKENALVKQIFLKVKFKITDMATKIIFSMILIYSFFKDYFLFSLFNKFYFKLNI